MTTTTTAATSWGAEPVRSLPATRAQKAELATKIEQARLDALPVQCRQWSDRLDLDALDAMGEVARLYKAEGYAPTRLHVPSMAKALKCDQRDAEGRLSRLLAAGAVEKIDRLANAPVYRPCARSTVPATKQEVVLGEVRAMVADATARIEGRPVPARAGKQESSFPPGTLMGLTRWD